MGRRSDRLLDLFDSSKLFFGPPLLMTSVDDSITSNNLGWPGFRRLCRCDVGLFVRDLEVAVPLLGDDLAGLFHCVDLCPMLPSSYLYGDIKAFS